MARHQRKDLVPLEASGSPWAHLKRIRKDHSALQVVGVTWEAFAHLHGYFQPLLQARHSAGNMKGAGRSTEDVLGLTLMWIHVPAYHVMLMLTFAFSPATLSAYLKD